MPPATVEAHLLFSCKISLLYGCVAGGVVVNPPVVSFLVILPDVFHLNPGVLNMCEQREINV